MGGEGQDSDAAAVRGDGGPDRSTPGIDGIDHGGQVSSGIRLQRGWGQERCCKSGVESGAISGYAGVARRPPGVLPMKIVPECRVQARRVYYCTVFDVKK